MFVLFILIFFRPPRFLSDKVQQFVMFQKIFQSLSGHMFIFCFCWSNQELATLVIYVISWPSS